MDKEKTMHITNSLRESFRSGVSKLAHRSCYCYTQDEQGHWVIYCPAAKTVCWIFERYLADNGLSKIVDGLAGQNIPSPTDKSRRNREALLKLISDEKYTGIVRLQKTVVQDDKQVRNRDERQHIYENDHPAIISAETYAQVQIMRIGRSQCSGVARHYESQPEMFL